jgi:hypothetical protein
MAPARSRARWAPSALQITTIGLDLAKNVFQVHGVDTTGQVVVRKSLRRSQMLPFFANCPLAWSAWRLAARRITGRELIKLGHEVRLTPLAYVKPYVKRGKTDAADAEAVCEAVTRPTMRFMPVKSTSIEHDPDPPLVLPNNTTVPSNMLRLDDNEVKRGWNADRALNLNRSSGVRQVADGAANASAAEIYDSGFEDPAPRCNSIVVH